MTAASPCPAGLRPRFDRRRAPFLTAMMSEEPRRQEWPRRRSAGSAALGLAIRPQNPLAELLAVRPSFFAKTVARCLHAPNDKRIRLASDAAQVPKRRSASPRRAARMARVSLAQTTLRICASDAQREDH